MFLGWMPPSASAIQAEYAEGTFFPAGSNQIQMLGIFLLYIISINNHLLLLFIKTIVCIIVWSQFYSVQATMLMTMFQHMYDYCMTKIMITGMIMDNGPFLHT
jgi:hypothetical protein